MMKLDLTTGGQAEVVSLGVMKSCVTSQEPRLESSVSFSSVIQKLITPGEFFAVDSGKRPCYHFAQLKK
ncbi:MAG: hypothetical protein H6657_31340 [Ardenticatenaceae bacterium]|nr:hypothetical protein [Anaerolineales bacterium]MCB8981924.1 hypothetical protein [Ardenticatenaceae bacterium]